MEFPEFSSNPRDYINYGTWAEQRIAELKKQELGFIQTLHSQSEEIQRLRAAALLALRCKTLPEAAQAKAALEAALSKGVSDE